MVRILVKPQVSGHFAKSLVMYYGRAPAFVRNIDRVWTRTRQQISLHLIPIRHSARSTAIYEFPTIPTDIDRLKELG